MVLGATNTLVETEEDEDQDMVYADAHSLHLIGDLLHLDKDLLER